MEQQGSGDNWWQRCLHARSALLNGTADSQEVKRVLRLCLILALTGCAMVAAALVGLYYG